MTKQNETAKSGGLKIIREFKAPVKLVFQAFSSAKSFAEWWGPVGMSMTIKHFDFKQGGKNHFKLEGNGQIMWALFRYGKINSPDLIEFISSFSDEAGNICKAPFPIDLPLEIFYELKLSEKNGVTTITLHGYPLNASAEQETNYYAIIPNMEEGFGGTFDKLDQHLEKVLK